MPELANVIWADGPELNPHEPPKAQIRAWGTWLENFITSLGMAISALYIRGSKDQLDAVTGATNGQVGLVVADDNEALRGVYVRTGGVWIKKLDLPADAADASADIAEAAKAAAIAARDTAEDYRDQAAGYVNDIVSEKEVPIYSTIDGVSAVSVPNGMTAIRVNGRSAIGDSSPVFAVQVTEDGSPLKSFQFKTNVNTKRWALSDRDVDIRSIGCKPGDASFTSNASRIQDLIDAKSGYGGTIIIPATVNPFILFDEDGDNYYLRPRSGVDLAGFGDRSQLKIADGQPSWLAAIKPWAGSLGHRLRNFSIDGNRANQATQVSQTGISGSADMSDFIWENLLVKNFNGRGVETNGDGDLFSNNGTNPVGIYEATGVAEFGELRNIRALNIKNKVIEARRSRHIKVFGGFAQSNYDYDGDTASSGFEASYSGDVKFYGGSVEHLGFENGPGFRVTNGAEDVAFFGGSIKKGRQGLVVIDARRVKFIGVYLENTLDGALISSADIAQLSRFATTDVLIDGCTFINPNNEGVVANVASFGTSVARVRVTNCRFESTDGNMQYGVRNGGGGPVDIRAWGNDYIGVTIGGTSGDVKGIPSNLKSDSFSSGFVDLNDDQVAIVPAPNGGTSGVIEVTVRDVSGWSAKAMYRCQSAANMTQLYNGIAGRINFVTGILTGTTGEDTDINVSAHTNGNIYIENRAGTARRIDYTFTNAT